MKKITYIFGPGRVSKLKKDTEYAKDFFYGFHYVSKDKNFETQIIEINPFSPTKNIFIRIFQKLDIIFNKVTFLRFHIHEIFNSNNFKKIITSNLIIFTNDQIALSFFPVLLLRKKLNSIVIVMGLFKQQENLKSYQSFLRPKIIHLFIKSVDKLVFLGKPEYNYALQNFPYFKDKFYFLPFSVDFKFWSENNKKFNKQTSNNILFVGNDSNRNYEFVKKLPSLLRDFEFTFITKQINKIENDENVNLISGDWYSESLNDVELRKIYQNAFLTIVPIKNTIQPSGQSVTLQSMSCGTPVLISKFDGFWDETLFNNNENIFFIEDFDYVKWSELIVKIYKEKSNLNSVTKKGSDLIRDNYGIDLFNKEFMKLIKNYL
jgi:glycosyltransferase involved in cell wall biosynthesis